MPKIEKLNNFIASKGTVLIDKAGDCISKYLPLIAFLSFLYLILFVIIPGVFNGILSP